MTKKASIRKRFFAWTLKKSDAINQQIYGSYKKELFQDIKGRVVEIGPGAGVNFNYLPAGIEWIGIEPNLAFHEILLAKARQRGIDARVIPSDSFPIPLEDAVADVVICTLVLCSVKNPAQMIHELKRLLKSNGKLIFIEHVAADKSSGLLKAQNILNPLNRLFADGCNCNRETWIDLQQAGFSHLQLSHYDIKGGLVLHKPHIVGYAIK
jgi:SAM-dependent methyltransferase